MNIPYSELHAHSSYSVLDGLPTPEEYVIRAKELGLKSMAITDHGTLAGHRDMYKAGIKHDMKIINPLIFVVGFADPFKFVFICCKCCFDYLAIAKET